MDQSSHLQPSDALVATMQASSSVPSGPRVAYRTGISQHGLIVVLKTAAAQVGPETVIYTQPTMSSSGKPKRQDEKSVEKRQLKRLRFEKLELARLAPILDHPVFHLFAQHHQSRTLLIHGRLIPGDPPSTSLGPSGSGLGLFSRSLTSHVQGIANYYALVFFCGNHMTPGHPSSGGEGMLRSLIFQLLARREFNTEHLPMEVDLDKVRSGNMQALCRLFTCLVARLPGDMTLLCVIAGVDHYEQPPFRETLKNVSRLLMDVCTDRWVMARMKTVFVSTRPSTLLVTYLRFREGMHVIDISNMALDIYRSRSLRPFNVRIAEAFQL